MRDKGLIKRRKEESTPPHQPLRRFNVALWFIVLLAILVIIGIVLWTTERAETPPPEADEPGIGAVNFKPQAPGETTHVEGIQEIYSARQRF